MIPRPKLSAEDLQQFQEIEDEDVRVHAYTTEIDQSFEKKAKNLVEVGIPKLQILTLISKGQKYYVELTGDKAFLSFS